MSDYVKGLVSVVMPTYKRSEKLYRAIESVLGQTYGNIELLLVNDNEPGDEFTEELIRNTEKYKSDERFVLVFQDRHINGAAARNAGIKKARGEYVAFLDDDDWWEKDKIEKQVAVLSGLDETWGCVSCRIRRYDNDRPIAELPAFRSGYVYKDILMLVSDFATGTILARHTALDDAGYFDEKLLRHQDLQLLVNFTFKYKLKQLDEFLHCCDVSDIRNRPDVLKIKNAKAALFESVAPVMDTLSGSEKRAVRIINRAEIGYVEIKNGKYLGAVGDMLPLLTSPKAFGCEITKIKNKLASKKVSKAK